MYATGQAPKKSKTNCPRRYALHTLESSKMQTPCDVKIYINKHTSVPIEFCDTREATHTQTRQIHAYRILYCREKVNHNFQYEKSVFGMQGCRGHSITMSNHGYKRQGTLARSVSFASATSLSSLARTPSLSLLCSRTPTSYPPGSHSLLPALAHGQHLSPL